MKAGRARGAEEATGTGFFIMVEGGKIDWACHANDAMATIGDMLDFDNAVGVPLEFYKKHPMRP
jgi:alkaline phosphatase